MLSLGLGLNPALFFMSISLTGPIVEKWLLSGEAIHKNLSVGGGGLVQIPVPEGKTFIITGIEMLPFANIITDDDLFAPANTLKIPVKQDLSTILQRLQFQLLFYGLNTNSVYNIRNKFFLSTNNRAQGAGNEDYTQPGISFEKHTFETFHVVENNCWLYLKYFDFNQNIGTATTDNYQLSFDGSQNWPPVNFYGYTDQSDITGYDFTPAPIGFNYINQGLQNTTLDRNNQFILPNFDIATDPNQNTNFKPPYPDQANTPLTASTLPSIPFYNISVIEINRRLSTKGLL